MSAGSMPAHSAKGEAAASGGRASLVSLAPFFSDATPLRLSVMVEMVNGAQEQAVIEFGTAHEVMFASKLPLEFGDRLKLSHADGSLLAKAEVVAVQFQGGEAAVAARFSQQVRNWIVK